MKKTLGVLGGMGPQASIRFYEEVIEHAQEKFEVSLNGDYPHMLISNLPVPDLIEDREQEEVAVQMLVAEAKRLEKAGADFLVLPCNTMHLFTNCIREAVSIPFLSMIDTVVDAVSEAEYKKVGLLGSTTTVESELYRFPLARRGIKVLVPEDQSSIVDVILRVVGGIVCHADADILTRAIASLGGCGAEAVILGCAELPLTVSRHHSSLPLFSSLSLLAQESCSKVYGYKKPNCWRRS